MNVVEVHGGMEVSALCHHANEAQDQFRFVQGREPGSVRLRLCGAVASVPFEVDLLEGVTVHMWQGKGIAAYAGLHFHEYLYCWAMLGLVQWRALLLNPLIRPDDFLHSQPSRCLYARQLFMEDYALSFDAPHICKSCLRFYGELCPKVEVGVLERLVAVIQQRAERPVAVVEA